MLSIEVYHLQFVSFVAQGLGFVVEFLKSKNQACMVSGNGRLMVEGFEQEIRVWYLGFRVWCSEQGGLSCRC